MNSSPKSNKPDTNFQENLSNDQNGKNKKLEELLKIFRNTAKYDKNIIMTLSSNNNIEQNDKKYNDYYYKEIDNPNIIHLFYQPLTSREYTQTYYSQASAIPYKQYNTKTIEFLAFCGATHIQTKKQSTKMNFIKSFKEYTTNYIKQLYIDSNPQLEISNNQIAPTQSCAMRQITSDLTHINCIPQPFIAKYSYHVTDTEVILAIETYIDAPIKYKGKIIGEYNVLSFNIDYRNCIIEKGKLEYSSLNNETYLFDIRIPCINCVINDFEATQEYQNGIKLLKFKRLSDQEVSCV